MLAYKMVNTKNRVKSSIYLPFDIDMDKRRDPNYKQISGHIPLELYKQFKTACFYRDIKQSEAVEIAIGNWVKEDSQGEKTS